MLHYLSSHQDSAFNWAVGVTSAPRQIPTLERTLISLSKAGWSDARLFAEPETLIPEQFCHLPVTQHDAMLGAFPNWYLGLSELVMREPKADGYLICQDDVLFAEGTRRYLETVLWPAPDAGVVSIYCPSHYAAEGKNGFIKEDRGWQSWGALAYLFSNQSVKLFLSDFDVLNHRFSGPAGGLRNIDSVVGRWCQATGRPYFVHFPSLTQHIGDTSTIWEKAGNTRRRCASHFLELVEPGSLDATDKEEISSAKIWSESNENKSVAQYSPALEIEQIWRFVGALTRHAVDGLRKCSSEEIEQRFMQCQTCPAFTGQHCNDCGCTCNEKKTFLNKLAWRSESCPRNRWPV